MSLVQAAITYRDRRARTEHPDGSFDNKSRCYPSSAEQCSCCASVRSPSAAWPYSLMQHCRTAEHIANLYGVNDRLVKLVARLLDECGEAQLLAIAERLENAIAMRERLTGKAITGAQVRRLIGQLNAMPVREAA
jgi:hypothetical protein